MQARDVAAAGGGPGRSDLAGRTSPRSGGPRRTAE